MKTGKGKFTFRVPNNHPTEAGAKKEGTFTFPICENEPEAKKTLKERGWSLLNVVNDALKAAGRNNAYQSATLPYRPVTTTPETLRERIIRDYIRAGVPESQARQQVESLMAH
jgi:hypothetical protein